ncbi:hypothetical protein MKZ38_001948 [Zalerion maritima]|uniref:Uncharacterized protein n=1 Tax=Zalerion maritima TaxID=339359 RepID=A0AAD5RPM4_9PEZI|nr:hypothetical protein MKZ38_001948 [Zalerion maritima]
MLRPKKRQKVGLRGGGLNDEEKQDIGLARESHYNPVSMSEYKRQGEMEPRQALEDEEWLPRPKKGAIKWNLGGNGRSGNGSEGSSKRKQKGDREPTDENKINSKTKSKDKRKSSYDVTEEHENVEVAFKQEASAKAPMGRGSQPLFTILATNSIRRHRSTSSRLDTISSPVPFLPRRSGRSVSRARTSTSPDSSNLENSLSRSQSLAQEIRAQLSSLSHFGIDGGDPQIQQVSRDDSQPNMEVLPSHNARSARPARDRSSNESMGDFGKQLMEEDEEIENEERYAEKLALEEQKRLGLRSKYF